MDLPELKGHASNGSVMVECTGDSSIASLGAN